MRIAKTIFLSPSLGGVGEVVGSFYYLITF